jgi:hypothetical protein
MEGIGEVGGMVVLGACGAWGRPRGPMEILVVWRVNDACTRPVTTVIQGFIFFFSLCLPLLTQ